MSTTNTPGTTTVIGTSQNDTLTAVGTVYVDGGAGDDLINSTLQSTLTVRLAPDSGVDTVKFDQTAASATSYPDKQILVDASVFAEDVVSRQAVTIDPVTNAVLDQNRNLVQIYGTSAALYIYEPALWTLQSLSDGSTRTLSSTVPNDRQVTGTSGNDTLSVGGTLGYLEHGFGGDGNDYMYATFSRQPVVLSGDAGDDSLYGSYLGDTLRGGTGNDYLDGKQGGDLYRFLRGWGNDTIVADNFDTIALGPGILKTDLAFRMNGSAVVIDIVGTTDSITLPKLGAWEGLQLRLGDGSVLSSADIFSALGGNAVVGGDGADVLVGSDKPNRLDGGRGDDVLRGGGSVDRLNGGDGNDSLDGGLGDDWLDGGAGNDTLAGGAGTNDLTGGEGADVYLISAAATKDTLHSDAQDTIAFEAGITSADVIFETRSFRFGPISSIPPDPLAGLVIVSRSPTTKLITVNFDSASRWDGVAFADGVKTQGSMLVGTDGNDVLAWTGTVRGGKGDDLYDFSPIRTPEGPQAGGLTVLYDAGDGHDTVRAVPPFPSFFSFNTIKLGAGIAAADVLVDVTSTLDVIKLRFKGLDGGLDAGGLGQVVFNDGTVWNANDIKERLLDLDNVFVGTSGSDVLPGGAGNDTLSGGAGDDWLAGGTGQNELTGGDGRDTYSLTEPQQSILHADNLDSVEFGAGVTLANLVRTLDTSGKLASNDVLAQVDASGARLTFASQAMMDAISLLFADGSSWRDKAIYGSAAGDTLDAGAYRGTNFVQGQLGDDVILGSSGDDRLDGGEGSDTLTGGAGADTFDYYTWSGNDLIHADGLDTLLLHGFTAADVSIGKLGAKGADIEVLSIQGAGTLTLDHFSTLAGLSMRFDDGQTVAWTDIMAAATKPDDLTLQGTANADTLKGGAGNDTLSGLAGNDSLLGAEGTDVLIGGVGNDVLDGGAGADTYQFAIGDGADTVMADSLDTIALGAGLTKANVQIGKLGAKTSNAVVLGMGSNASDTITLANAGGWGGLTLKFADGSSLTGADIMAAATKPDNLTLNGTAKADSLTGGAGNDTLNGLAGNDTLAGGKGNDSLIGGKGNDTYLFNRGDGQDVIVDTDSTLFNSDLLKLGGATSKQLWLSKSGNNLNIQILGTQDKVTVQNWFAGSANQVEKITASDGKSLSASKVQALVSAMASFTPPADAASLPANTPAAINKLIASSWA